MTRAVLTRAVLTLSVACSLVLVAALTSPAVADTPKNWERPPDVSLLSYLLVLVIIPLGLAIVVTLLTVLPSLARDRAQQPGQSWRGDSEWFGGPAEGVRAADRVTPEQVDTGSTGTGGTSAGW